MQRRLQAWHESFSRFLPGSELSRLNDDPRSEVPVSRRWRARARRVRAAAELTHAASSTARCSHRSRRPVTSATCARRIPLSRALALAPARRPAGARSPAVLAQRRGRPRARRPSIRPPGVKLDSGGLAKGLFADMLAGAAGRPRGFAIDCAGDLALGGTDELPRAVDVACPFDGRTLHTFELRRGGVATSGIGRRSWLDGDGRPAHHLLDPASGRPAFTGIVQVTALAPSALLAEIRAKAALLSGPRGAARWLPDGGVVVLDDGTHRAIEPPHEVTLHELSGFLRAAERDSAQRSAA